MPLITVTSGPRNAHTDAASGLRFYTWQGVDYPSVTTIRRMAGLPFRLHQWTISQVVKRAVLQHDDLTAMLDRPRRPRERVRDKNVVKEASKWLRAAATEERDLKARIGTDVHDAATSLKRVSDVPDHLKKKLLQFYDWLDTSGAEIIAVERQVFNLTLGYAGTFDLLVRMPNGDIFVVDLKTGNGTYTDHAFQLCLYGMAEFTGESDVIDLGLTKLLDNAKGMALLHLSDDGWKWQEVKMTPELYHAAQGLLKFAVFAFEHEDIDALLSDTYEGAATP